MLALQAAPTGRDMRQVLAINVPVMSYGKTPEQIVNFYKVIIERAKALPGVDPLMLAIAGLVFIYWWANK